MTRSDGFCFWLLGLELRRSMTITRVRKKLTKWCAMLFRGRRRIDFVLDRNRSIRATRKTWPKLDNRWGSSDLFRTDHCRVPCWDRWRRRRRWAAPTAGRRERRYRLVLRLLYRIAFDFLKMVEKSLNTSLHIFFTALSQISFYTFFLNQVEN